MAESGKLAGQYTPATACGGKGGKITVLPLLCQLKLLISDSKQAVSKEVDQPHKKA